MSDVDRLPKQLENMMNFRKTRDLPVVVSAIKTR